MRDLPQVQRLLERDDALTLAERMGRPALLSALRDVLAQVREALRAGAMSAAPVPAEIIALAGERLAAAEHPTLTRVINATGIVLHTNLGRAPMAREAAEAAARVAEGYSNLELDLATGRRGSRSAAVEAQILALTGAEAGLAVNNGAAAILLAVAALAGGGEVIVSRGELVEIGGGFRVPDVIAAGGARLVEVGSTNRTRIGDYVEAIGRETRAVLKVHQSNFRTIGFTEEAEIGALRSCGLPVIVDLGSGLIRPSDRSSEPTIANVIRAGADIVTCSGDKLLGGPQAGLVAGRADLVERLRRHPMMRALRLDKMSLAALEATLLLHRHRPGDVPVNRMLAQDRAVLAARAERLRALVGVGEVVDSEGFAGGGALPEEQVASIALAVDEALAEPLRLSRQPVLGWIHKGRLLLDMLAVADDEVPMLAEALKAVL